MAIITKDGKTLASLTKPKPVPAPKSKKKQSKPVTPKPDPTFNSSPQAPPVDPPKNPKAGTQPYKPGNPKPGSPGWKAFTKRRWIQNHLTTTSTRPGINQTLSDYNTLAASLGADNEPNASAASLAAYNAGLAGSGLRPEDEAKRQKNITDVGAELLKGLADIQIANANGANGGVGLFKQGAQGADLSTQGQIFAAGGVAAPTVAPEAALTLGTIAANNNNMFAGQQAGAAKQLSLYHQSQRQNDQAARDKLAAQRAADYLSLLTNEKNADSTKISNLLTYNLYNTQNTTKQTISDKTLAQNAAIASQKASAKVIDQQIAAANAETKRLAANGTITKAQADQRNKKSALLKDVLTHQNGATGTSTWTVNVIEPVKVPATTGGPLNDGKDVNNGQIYTTKLQPRVIKNISAAQYQQFVNSGPMGARKLAFLGAKSGSKLVPGTAPTKTTTGTAGPAWTPKQVRTYLSQSGLYSPADITSIIASLGNPAKAKALAASIFNYPAPPTP